MRACLKGTLTACVIGFALIVPARAQTQAPKGVTAGEFFKNVTASTLK